MGGILYWLYAPVAWGYCWCVTQSIFKQITELLFKPPCECCSNLMVTELSTIFLHINAFFLMSKAASGKV